MTAPQILMLPNLNNAGQRTPPIATGFGLIRFCKLISGSEPVLCITNCVTRRKPPPQLPARGGAARLPNGWRESAWRRTASSAAKQPFEQAPEADGGAVIDPIVSGSLRVGDPSPTAWGFQAETVLHHPFNGCSGRNAAFDAWSADSESHFAPLPLATHAIMITVQVVGIGRADRNRSLDDGVVAPTTGAVQIGAVVS